MNRKALQRIIRGVIRLFALGLAGLIAGSGVLAALWLADARPVLFWTAAGVVIAGVLAWILGGEQ